MANFIGANLELTDLTKVNLEWANLRCANLKEANFREAHYLTFEQLSKVKIFNNAKLDEKRLNSLRKKHAHTFKR